MGLRGPHGRLDDAEPVAHLRHRRHVHRQGDGVRRQGRHGDRERCRSRSRRAPRGCIANAIRDDFNGTELGAGWSVVRRDGTLTVANGVVTIPTQAGDLYQTANTAKNVVLRTAPTGACTMTAKINHKGLVQYQQGGIIVYGDDDNYVKLDRTATNTAATANTEFFEFIEEVDATARNATADHTANLAATFPQDFYVRIVWDGTNLTGTTRPTAARGRPRPCLDGDAGERQGRLLRALQRGDDDGRRRSSTSGRSRARTWTRAARPARTPLP